MQKTRVLFLAVVFFISPLFFYAQEILSNLSYNPVINEKWSQTEGASLKKSSLLDTIEITSTPFLDDFSINNVYPDTSWWIDKYVFINRDFPIAPITVGVATFDGLDASGLPYDWSIQEPNTKEADRLTSKAINLGSPLSKADSIYLSFYYQPKGRGDEPESKDSLILEFKSPTKDWTKVWYKKGYDPLNDSSFHVVMIPIVDTAYLKKGFQFRFKNYATSSGNTDHWHIDYVYLNKSRNFADTIREDVAFVYNPPSLLSNYQAMPWEQYNAGEMKSTIHSYMRNNMNAQKNTNYKYFIKDNLGNLLNTYDGGSTNLDSYNTIGYNNYGPHVTPTVSYSFSSLSDTATFFVEHELVSFPDVDILNNKTTFYQKFNNYYAYDDGTAEKSYAINQPFAYSAYQFTLNNNDTLKAIQVFFNPVFENNQQGANKENPIKIIVWSDNNGKPGNIIYQADTVVYAVYEYGHNTFHTFQIGTSGIALGSGIFYVGWQQVNSNFVRVGYDVNTNSKSKIFYNLSGTWAGSIYNGSLMVRPIMRKLYPISGIAEYNTNQLKREFIDIYPNPANDFLKLSSVDAYAQNQTIIFYDLFGRIILEERLDMYPKLINTSTILSGIYFLEIRENNNSVIQTSKIIVTH